MALGVSQSRQYPESNDSLMIVVSVYSETLERKREASLQVMRICGPESVYRKAVAKV